MLISLWTDCITLIASQQCKMQFQKCTGGSIKRKAEFNVDGTHHRILVVNDFLPVTPTWNTLMSGIKLFKIYNSCLLNCFVLCS